MTKILAFSWKVTYFCSPEKMRERVDFLRPGPKNFYSDPLSFELVLDQVKRFFLASVQFFYASLAGLNCRKSYEARVACIVTSYKHVYYWM